MKIWITFGFAAWMFLVADASAEATSGFARGYIERTYNSPGVALLDSFYFRYSSEDHHVTSISAKVQANGRILLALADKNNDDEYFYSVEHKRRVDAGIITGSFVDVCLGGNCLYPLASPGPSYIFVIRSFRFYYRDDDHHVDQIGIVRESRGVRTYFNDQNDDDSYIVYVDYAWLPTSMVERTGRLTGVDDGGGVQRSLTNANRAVISGFRVNYLYGGDHHLRDIGVHTRTSDVQIYYSDKNADDDFSYLFDYAVLR